MAALCMVYLVSCIATYEAGDKIIQIYFYSV